MSRQSNHPVPKWCHARRARSADRSGLLRENKQAKSLSKRNQDIKELSRDIRRLQRNSEGGSRVIHENFMAV